MTDGGGLLIFVATVTGAHVFIVASRLANIDLSWTPYFAGGIFYLLLPVC